MLSTLDVGICTLGQVSGQDTHLGHSIASGALLKQGPEAVFQWLRGVSAVLHKTLKLKY